MRIVIFKINHLGDNVVFVPVVQELRRRFPDQRMTLLTTPEAAELYGGRLGPQEILACPKQGFDKSYRRPWILARWIWRVRRLHPGACLVSFDQGYAASLAAKYSGAEIRIGPRLEKARAAGALTQEIPSPADARPVSWNWSMGRALALALGSDEGWPERPRPPDLRHLLPNGPRPRGPRRRVVVHPGARGPLNQWPAANFASVAASLAGEFEVVWIMHGSATAPAPAGTVGASPGTVCELAEWLAGADLFLGNNSGPMHLANALGCHGVAVTGPSAKGWDPYWNSERWSVLRHPDLYCAPCERIERELVGCANTENPMACLNYWTPQKVLEACRSRLGRQGGRAA